MIFSPTSTCICWYYNSKFFDFYDMVPIVLREFYDKMGSESFTNIDLESGILKLFHKYGMVSQAEYQCTHWKMAAKVKYIKCSEYKVFSDNEIFMIAIYWYFADDYLKILKKNDDNYVIHCKRVKFKKYLNKLV